MLVSALPLIHVRAVIKGSVARFKRILFVMADSVRRLAIDHGQVGLVVEKHRGIGRLQTFVQLKRLLHHFGCILGNLGTLSELSLLHLLLMLLLSLNSLDLRNVSLQPG